jgi:hypothetical protein
VNSLCLLISKLGLDEVRVLNALQGEAGLISDNCVTAADVAGLNCFHACAWVLEHQERLR